MNNDDTDGVAVLDALRGSLDDVSMGTPVEQIITAGRQRVRRRRLTGGATALVAVAAVALAVTTHATPSAAPAVATDTTTQGALHIEAVAYTVDKAADGRITVTWDKQRYVEDREGLQEALRAAGFPVLIKVGEFCTGPHDDGTLDPRGIGPGVDRVMKGEATPDGRARFVFTPSAMPAGKQLFIGYLSTAQLAVTHGAPGSVERLISTGVPLTCTTVAPPVEVGRGDGTQSEDTKPSK
jgi:hypothetical protein